MFRRKITAETFAVEPGNHAEARWDSGRDTTEGAIPGPAGNFHERLQPGRSEPSDRGRANDVSAKALQPYGTEQVSAERTGPTRNEATLMKGTKLA